MSIAPLTEGTNHVTDLTEFLLARIADDEDVVRHCLEALDAGRTDYAGQVARRTGPLSTVTSSSHCGQDMGPRGTVEATPGRVLAECRAKRQAIEAAWADHLQIEGEWGHGRGRDELSALNDYPDVVCLLALPYADHPDYQQEWKS